MSHVKQYRVWVLYGASACKSVILGYPSEKMERQEFFRQTADRGLNLVRGIYNSALAKRNESKARKVAYRELFTLFDQIFDENSLLAHKHGETKQTIDLPNWNNGRIILERSLSENPRDRRHYMHLQNAAFYDDSNPDAKTMTIGLSQIASEIVPRDIEIGDSLNWADNPAKSDFSRSLTAAEAQDIGDWLNEWRQYLSNKPAKN